MKAFLAIGAVLAIVPFVPWGSFLSSTISTGAAVNVLQKVVIDDLSEYGPAAGQEVNVNDLATFPANDHWVFTYPTSGDPTTDAENPNTFQKFELIRLPESLGGADMQATDFVAFSKVCVHLWCSPNYVPSAQKFECPCHGSEYEVPDGKAVAGPASIQAFPTNAIPMLSLQADSQGNLYCVSINRDPRLPFPNDGVPNPIEANGEIGYGRDYESYYTFIKPVGQVPANTAGLTEEISG